MIEPFHIVLVEPEIPANTGNIARLCAATRSMLHLIHPIGFRLDHTSFQRAGMDYLDIAQIREHPSLEICLQDVRSSIYYLTTKMGEAYWNKKFQPGDYCVFGRETKGLPVELLTLHKTSCLTIPMIEPRARSLNLATSVSIVLYEALRQQRIRSPKPKVDGSPPCEP